VLLKTQAVSVPGRMELQDIDNKRVIMDGAHNTSKMTAFIDSYQKTYPDTKPPVLLAFKDDKEYRELIPMLGSFANKIIVTTFNTSQDLPVKSLDAQLLADEFKKAGIEAIAIPNQQAALQALLNEPGDMAVITGSFYLLSQLRKSKLKT
jgi:dihydrofolate synthase/folylpolyglutamate synthase